MSVKASDEIYYFFMKVGYSNSFLQHAEALGGLLVGFVGDGIPGIDQTGLCKRNGEKLDLIYATVASSPSWRSKVRIVTYSKDAMLIWRPTGDLHCLDQAAGGLDWGNRELYAKFPRDWHETAKSKWNGIGSQTFYDYHFGERGWKLIPADLETVISRELLIAPVDSLAVWQNFSRNTFQPMFSLDGNQHLQRQQWLKNIPSLPTFTITENSSVDERAFGKFVRYYLNRKCSQDRQHEAHAPSSLEKSSTALSILNPAQVETAAMLISQDLGLTVDVGLGKGLDTVDVKATVRHLEPEARKNRIRHAVAVLEGVGVEFSDTLKHAVISTATLRVQCKAASGIEAEGTVLVVEPCSTDESRKDRLVLERILEKVDQFAAFRNWLSLLEYDLSV